ncbi:DUF397 domain-containing protein [Nocardiopsis halotolerans]|uniref:DUF397 domain-containing protein n=1 Tax=Nocardiopsis halotolerans TaxID=124252 RepID=UPI000475B211|nr:DUF397 domain-containing protein [Nocardiopsis halotolerans]
MKGLGREPGRWRTSSHSSGESASCVEVMLRPPRCVGLRDSTHRDHATLALPAHQWVALLRIAVDA